jgi:hypothetical protein
VRGLARDWEANDRLEAAVCARLQLDLAAVGVDEPLHDREPEPEAAFALVGAPEAVEGARDLVAGHARSAVQDANFDPAVCTRGGEVDAGAGGRDFERVREQVVEYLLDPARGDEGVRAAVGARLELHLLLLGQRRPGLDALVDRGGDVELNGGAGGPVGTSESEQSVDERAEALEFVERALQFLALLRPGVLGEVLEPQAERGQRGAELVGSIGDAVSKLRRRLATEPLAA